MALVIDAHTHGTHLLPPPVQALRRATVRSHPAEVTFAALAAAGVDVIAAAVGDRLVTRWYWPASDWTAVHRQLDKLRADAAAAGCQLATTIAELRAAKDAGRPAVVLGREGADAVGGDPARLADLHAAGVRVVGLVHFADNALAPSPCPGTGVRPARRCGRAGATPA